MYHFTVVLLKRLGAHGAFLHFDLPFSFMCDFDVILQLTLLYELFIAMLATEVCLRMLFSMLHQRVLIEEGRATAFADNLTNV